jgi:ABC-2 type transport system ATP-binding protein
VHSANIRHIPGKEVKKAVMDVLGRCGITHFQKRVIRNLSGGYQQRVGIAQAIIHNPDFVVLDEPTNGLDPNQIVEIRHLVKEIAEERTVVLSTHILPEVQATCDYIRMLEQGNLVFAGTVEDFDNYILPTTILVTLLAMPSVAELRTIPDVTAVEELGGAKYRLQFTNADEAMEKVVEMSVARGWRLKEIQLERSSLDTIFSELSRKAQ